MPEPSTPLVYWPLLLAAAYLLGSVPFALLLGRARGLDLRSAGSGNVGAGNLARLTDWRFGAVAGALDALKGLLPVWLARSWGMSVGAAALAGLAAVVGHNWSVWLRGRSGRGLAASFGVVLGLSPVLLVWPAGWSLVGVKIGGGLAGFLGWGMLPVVAVALGRPPAESLFLMLLALVLMVRRMQGNPHSPRGPGPALRRAVYDQDGVARDYPEGAEDPLTP